MSASAPASPAGSPPSTPPPAPASPPPRRPPSMHPSAEPATPPPPPPPLALCSPAQLPQPAPALREVYGSLWNALRASERAGRWLLVALRSSPIRFSAATASNSLPRPFLAPRQLVDSVSAWRPGHGTNRESYDSFYPVREGPYPHLALLDPRSGERLAVWGSDVEVEWENVVPFLTDFVENHSLENGAVGNLHIWDKAPEVRTRREEARKTENLPPTSMMDDEDAAIAAAIEASLADVYPPGSSDHDSYTQSMDEDEDAEDEDKEDDSESGSEVVRPHVQHENGARNSVDSHQSLNLEEMEETSDRDSNDVSRNSSISAGRMNTRQPESAPIPMPARRIPGSASANASTPIHAGSPRTWSDVVAGDSPASYPGVRGRFGVHRRTSGSDDDDHNDADDEGSSSEESERRRLTRRISTPGRAPPLASSVESLASSYMERMHSRFKSMTDPALAEARLLRKVQDEELAASLEADRQRAAKEKAEAEAASRRKAATIEAQKRLPEEPMAGDPDAVSIGIRLAGFPRIVRAFRKTDTMDSVADLVVSKEFIDLEGKNPADILRLPGMLLTNARWTTPIGEVTGSTRAVMFFVLQ